MPARCLGPARAQLSFPAWRQHRFKVGKLDPASDVDSCPVTAQGVSGDGVAGSPVPPDRGRAVYHRLGSKVPRTRGSGRCSEGLPGGPGQGVSFQLQSFCSEL